MLTILEDVCKRFQKQVALDHVNLRIDRGQLVAVLGLNGAGKTTLLRCLSGLVVPDAGEIRYDDEIFHRDRIDLRRRFFFLPDVPPYLAESTVIDHVSMMMQLYERDEDDSALDRIVGLFKEFDLLEHAETRIAELSRGQAYKAGLTALLAVEPDLWIIDEPMASGMDASAIVAFKRHAVAARNRGASIIYSTQIVDVVERFSDQVCILDHGQVRAFGRLANIKGSRDVSEDLLALFRQPELTEL